MIKKNAIFSFLLSIIIYSGLVQAAVSNKTHEAFSKKAVQNGWRKVDDAFSKKYYMVYNNTGYKVHVVKAKKVKGSWYDLSSDYCVLKPGGSRRFTGSGKAPEIVYLFRTKKGLIPYNKNSGDGQCVSDTGSLPPSGTALIGGRPNSLLGPVALDGNLKKTYIRDGKKNYFMDMGKPTTTSIYLNRSGVDGLTGKLYFRYN